MEGIKSFTAKLLCVLLVHWNLSLNELLWLTFFLYYYACEKSNSKTHLHWQQWRGLRGKNLLIWLLRFSNFRLWLPSVIWQHPIWLRMFYHSCDVFFFLIPSSPSSTPMQGAILLMCSCRCSNHRESCLKQKEICVKATNSGDRVGF